MVFRVIDQYRHAVGVAQHERHLRLIGDEDIVTGEYLTSVNFLDAAHVGGVALVGADRILAPQAERRARPVEILRTAAGSSPVPVVRFSEAYLPVLTPP